MHFARSLLVLMGLVGAAAQVTVPTAAKFCGTSKGRRCPNKVTLGSGNNTVISVGGTPILDLTKTSALVKVEGSVTFQSKKLIATITEDVTLTTLGKTTIVSGDVDLSSTGKITLLGSEGVFYPAAAAAAGVIEEGDRTSQLCSAGVPVMDPLDPALPTAPPSIPLVQSNLLGTMAIKKFGLLSTQPLTHICALYPFNTDGTPFVPNARGFFTPQELALAAKIMPVWLPLRTEPPAKPWLKLDGSAA